MEGYPWGNGNDRAGLWQWDYATPKEGGGGCCWDGQGETGEGAGRGPQETPQPGPSTWLASPAGGWGQARRSLSFSLPTL